MKKLLLGLTLSTSILTNLTIPVFAQSIVRTETMPKQAKLLLPTKIDPQQQTLPQQSQSIPEKQRPTIQQPAPQSITLPQSTAIIVSFPMSMQIDAGQHKDYPTTLPLAQAIQDSQGRVILPESTPVSISLKPIEGGVQIVAKSIVFNGQVVNLQATGDVIPGTTITQVSSEENAINNGALWGRVIGSVVGFATNADPDQFDRFAMGGYAIGSILGSRSPKSKRVVLIPQGSVFVLSMQSPLNLSLQP